MADADKKPLTPEQLQARIDQLETDKQALEAQNAELSAAPTGSLDAEVAKLKKSFKVPEGEAAYTHVAETMHNGIALEAVKIGVYDPKQYEKQISTQKGYQGEVLHAGKVK